MFSKQAVKQILLSLISSVIQLFYFKYSNILKYCEKVLDFRFTKHPLHNKGQEPLLWQAFELHSAQMPVTPPGNPIQPLYCCLAPPASSHSIYNAFSHLQAYWYLFNLPYHNLITVCFILLFIFFCALSLHICILSFLKDRDHMLSALFIPFSVLDMYYISSHWMNYQNNTVQPRKAGTVIISSSGLLIVNECRGGEGRGGLVF